MKNIFLLLVLVFNIGRATAHKNIIVFEKYGNVKVLLQTGFDYSEIDKIKIIGKLSEKLCNKLSFKDTLLIEYINDYTDGYPQDFYKFENDNKSFDFYDEFGKSKDSKKEKGLSIRINAQRIQVKNILLLVEYAIENRADLSKKLQARKLQGTYDDEKGQHSEFVMETIPDELLNQIFTTKSYKVNQLLHEKVEFLTQMHFGLEYYWKNDKFVFAKKLNKDETKQLFAIDDFYYCLITENKGAVVFVDEKNFYFVDLKRGDVSNLIHIKSGNYWIFKPNSMFSDKIILYNQYVELNLFLTDKWKLITEF